MSNVYYVIIHNTLLMNTRNKKTFYSILKPFVLLTILTLSFFSVPVLASQENANTATVSILFAGQISKVQTVGERIQINGTTFTLNGQTIRLTGVHMTLWPDSETRYPKEFFE